MHCRGLHGAAIAAFPSGFLCCALPYVAPYCAAGGIRVVSGRATATVRQQGQWHALASFGATVRRCLFLGVAVRCRIGLSIVPELIRAFALSYKPSHHKARPGSEVNTRATTIARQ